MLCNNNVNSWNMTCWSTYDNVYKWRHYGDDSIEELNNFIVNCNVMDRYLLDACCLVSAIARCPSGFYGEELLFSMVFYIIHSESAERRFWRHFSRRFLLYIYKPSFHKISHPRTTHTGIIIFIRATFNVWWILIDHFQFMFSCIFR